MGLGINYVILANILISLITSSTTDPIFQQYFSHIVVISFIGGENNRPVASHWQTYHIVLYRVHLAWEGFELTTLVKIIVLVIKNRLW